MILDISYTDGVGIQYTKAVFQHEKNVSINFQQAPLANPFMVDISNDSEHGNAVRYKAISMPILIPDDYFVDGSYVHVWIYTTNGVTQVVIPVVARPTPIRAPSEQEGAQITYDYNTVDENLTLLRSFESAITENMEDS